MSSPSSPVDRPGPALVVTDLGDPDYYRAGPDPELVRIRPVRAVGVTGTGAPGSATHLAAVDLVTAAAARLVCGAPPPLEGQWWVEDPRPPFEVPREEWHWRLLVRVPEDADATHLAGGVEPVDLDEGWCVQLLHTGSYETEPASLERLWSFVTSQGLRPHGRHHEVYLRFEPDAPDDALTVLRQPVVRPGAGSSRRPQGLP